MSKWDMVPLSKLLTQDKTYFNSIEDKIYPKLSVRLYGKGVILDSPANGSLIKMQKHQIAKADQVILSEIWGKKGAIGIVPPEGSGALCTSHFFLFNVDQSAVDLGWLELIFKANYLEQQLSAGARGTTGYAAVRPKHLLSAEIPLPPLHEQQRIINRIKNMLHKIEELVITHKSLEEMINEFNQSLSNRRFRDLSHDHPIKTLGEVSHHVTSGPRDWGGNYADDGWRFYRAQDITADGQIAISRKAFIDKSNDRPSARLSEGDLLIVITGATVGRSALYTNVNEPGYISQHVALCRLDQNEVIPEYAHYALLSPFGRDQLLANQYGQGKPGLNLSQIKSIIIPVPPIHIQQELLIDLRRNYSQINHLKHLESHTKNEVDLLPASILARAFSGEL